MITAKLEALHTTPPSVTLSHGGKALSIPCAAADLTGLVAGRGYKLGLTTLPGVNSVIPATGSHTGGTAVAITGMGFTGAVGVKFGSAAATSVVVVSDTEITCHVPPGAAGVVNVTVDTPAGGTPATTSDHFTYT